MGISRGAAEGSIKMTCTGDGKATVNLIPMETVIVALDLEQSIGN